MSAGQRSQSHLGQSACEDQQLQDSVGWDGNCPNNVWHMVHTQQILCEYLVKERALLLICSAQCFLVWCPLQHQDIPGLSALMEPGVRIVLQTSRWEVRPQVFKPSGDTALPLTQHPAPGDLRTGADTDAALGWPLAVHKPQNLQIVIFTHKTGLKVPAQLFVQCENLFQIRPVAIC